MSCAPKLDQAMAQMQAQAQIDQLNQKIQAQDWTKDINYRDQATGLCPSCGQESGAGQILRVVRPPAGRRAVGEDNSAVIVELR